MSTLSTPSPSAAAGCSLDSVIATGELARRADRAPDRDAEVKAERELTRQLAQAPHDFFQKLVDVILRLCGADSAGVSLLDVGAGRFVWPALSGGLASHVGGGTPSDFGPCGTVLDRNEPMLFARPGRHFTYLQALTPPVEEALLVPFHLDGKAVGTVWAVMHGQERRFQPEDLRLLRNLSGFAAAAYKVLVRVGAVKRS